jgi:hypothetical protein
MKRYTEVVLVGINATLRRNKVYDFGELAYIIR